MSKKVQPKKENQVKRWPGTNASGQGVYLARQAALASSKLEATAGWPSNLVKCHPALYIQVKNVINNFKSHNMSPVKNVTRAHQKDSLKSHKIYVKVREAII